MAYNTNAILRDTNGDPIPQYYDVVAGEFKPLTEASFGEEHFGLSTDTKPTPEKVGALFYEIDTRIFHIWDGTSWDVFMYV